MTTMTARRHPLGPDRPRLDTAWDASRLRHAWDERNPNPTQVAAALGVTTETLRRWRLGRNVPDAIEIGLLARLLGTTRDALLPPE